MKKEKKEIEKHTCFGIYSREPGARWYSTFIYTKQFIMLQSLHWSLYTSGTLTIGEKTGSETVNQ